MRARVATVDDAEAIGRIHTVAWQVGYEHVFGVEALATLDIDARVRQWRERLAGGGDAIEGVELLVVEDDRHAVVGWAAAGPSEGDDADTSTAELYGIYVDPDAWGREAGSALMRATLDRLRKRDFDTVVLWVLEDNPRARRFYERQRWHADGATKNEVFFEIPVDVVRYRITL